MSSLWPLFDLRLHTPRLELRLPTDDELVDVAALADDIHPVDSNPFYVAWTRGDSPARERAILQYHWKGRAEWSANAWELNLVAFRDGQLIGSQSIGASGFAVTRSVATGSWLAQPHQGLGLGKEMRLAVLALAFDGLNTIEAHTSARPENDASLGVTRSLGYEPNGVGRLAYGGEEPVEDQRFRMTRERWQERHAGHGVEIEGLDGCVDMFGA